MSTMHRIDTARNNGTARKQFITAVEKALTELDQGRGATACMADVKEAYSTLKGRTTRKGKEARE